MIFKLWSDLETFYLYLHSFACHPKYGHVSGQNVLVTTVQ
jgi:hypothetical protein